MIPPQYQHAEMGLNPDNPDTWIQDNDEDVNHQQQQNDYITIAEGNYEGYEEYESEGEEDPMGYDDAAALATLAKPAVDIADTYSAMDAYGIQTNPTELTLGLTLKCGFADDDPDLIQPQITNWEAPHKN